MQKKKVNLQETAEGKYPLLLLTWTDAGTITHGDWLSADEILQEAIPEKFINTTVGWLLKETEDALVLASQIATDHEMPRYDLCMWIPKVLVRSRKVIKV